MNRRPPVIGTIALIAFTTLLIVLRYGYFLSFPNNMVIEPYGDGFKAYTVIWYHAKYDSTYSHFEGMNYPYGEHAVPGATQPLISNSIKLVSHLFGDITDWTVHIVHLSMLLGILLCSLFLFLILCRLNVPWWFALLGAIGITFLAPQTHRMYSHYGLAHPEVIPIAIYLLMRWHEKAHWKWSVFMMVVVLAFSMIHFYYFAILAFLISFYYLLRFIGDADRWTNLKVYLPHYAIKILIPLVFFFFWMIYNSPVDDRTSMPWGYLYYSTNLQGIFTSLYQPHFEWLNENGVRFKWIDFENGSYIGLIAGLFCVIVFIRSLITIGRKPFLAVESGEWQKRFLLCLLGAALLILLFAMGLPFKLPGWEDTLKYTGPIKMFRGVGRFAWIFYYVINILAVASLWFWIKRRRNKVVKILVPVLFFGLFYYEAYHHNQAFSIGLDPIYEFESKAYYTEKSGIDFDQFQAILTIPYYNVGSDNFWVTIPNLGLILQKSLLLSIETGLPTTSAMLTRSSISQTIDQIQLVTEPYRYPKILEQYPNDKPFLLVWDHPRYVENQHLYKHLEGQGTLLYEEGDLKLFSLPIQSFEKRLESKRDSIRAELASRPLFTAPPFLSSDSAATFLYEGFEEEGSDNPYWGKGGLQRTMQDSILLFSGALQDLEPGEDYILSFWAFVNQDLVVRSAFNLYETDVASGKCVQKQHTILNREVFQRVFDNNGWALFEYPFQPKSAHGRFTVSIANSVLNGVDVYFDEVMIRKRSTDLYQRENDYFQKNNRFFFTD